jgi:hypothetical protein
MDMAPVAPGTARAGRLAVRLRQVLQHQHQLRQLLQHQLRRQRMCVQLGTRSNAMVTGAVKAVKPVPGQDFVIPLLHQEDQMLVQSLRALLFRLL